MLSVEESGGGGDGGCAGAYRVLFRVKANAALQVALWPLPPYVLLSNGLHRHYLLGG